MNAPHPGTATPLPTGTLAADVGVVRLRVEYPANPTLQRVAAVVVRAESPPTAPATPLPSAVGFLTVRLTAGGCQIVPEELSLNLAQTTPATFFLTPLATGPLPGTAVEVLRQGQKAQRIALRMSAGRRGGWRRWLLAAVSLPLAWWWLAGANPVAVSEAVAGKLPPGPWTASAGPAVRQAVEALAGAEREFYVGLLLAAVFLGAALVAALAGVVRRRTLVGPPLTLTAITPPPPSSRGRAVPPYLTPVPPEELNRVSL